MNNKQNDITILTAVNELDSIAAELSRARSLLRVLNTNYFGDILVDSDENGNETPKDTYKNRFILFDQYEEYCALLDAVYDKVESQIKHAQDISNHLCPQGCLNKQVKKIEAPA